jgi:predicted MFS family arabinose efflux permease
MSRSVTLYTASFSVGVGLSFLISQLVADFYGWRVAFFVTGAAPLAMVMVCLVLAPFRPKPSPGHPLDFRPVLRNRAALGYILGYGAHCFELYGMRTWIVAFWTFVVARNAGDVWLGPVAVSVLVTLLSLPASVLGNEPSILFGRRRAITAIMLASAAVAVAIGCSATLSPVLLLPLVLLYGLTVPGDSGSLTAGMSQSAVPAHRGATMALHSTVGFGIPALGAWGTGVALDVAGGPNSATGWLAAFSLLAAAILLGPVALRWAPARL